MTDAADVIVVGLGAMGSATCRQLSARGSSVIGIDRHAPPHAYGSTHGDTRITRLAVGEGAEYVPLVMRSHELWRELERDAGVSLLTQCGGVILGDPGSDFVRDTERIAREHGIEHEHLSGDELRRRFPMLATGEDTEGYYEPAAGYVRPEAAVRAQLELAVQQGARLRLGETVLRFSAGAGGVKVVTDRGVCTADQLVLCPGPWITELMPQRVGHFAVYRQLLHWFAIDRGYAELARMPVFVWDFGGERGDFVHLRGFYGFPAVDGATGGVKLATESYAETSTPDGRQHPASDAEVAAMHREYVASRLPWLSSAAVRTASCLYTCTRGSRFVIDRHPEHDAVIIVSACSGHGFKHSPAIGEAVAQWVTAGRAEIDLSPFALSLS